MLTRRHLILCLKDKSNCLVSVTAQPTPSSSPLSVTVKFQDRVTRSAALTLCPPLSQSESDKAICVSFSPLKSQHSENRQRKHSRNNRRCPLTVTVSQFEKTS